MAFKRSGSNKKGIISQITPLAIGIGGGFVGNQLTGMIEKQSFMAGKEAMAPVVTLAAAFGASMFLGETMKNFANGAAIVAGTELLEGLVSKTATAVKGVAPMGFTPELEVTGPQAYPTYGGGSLQ